MKKIYLHHYVFIQILMFLFQTLPSSSFPKNTNSTLSNLKSLFRDKEINKQLHFDIFAQNFHKNEKENLRRCKREFHNQNNALYKKSPIKRETNYKTIFENDDIEIQEEELEQEESENKNIKRFRRNNKKSKSKGNFKKRKIIENLKDKEKNVKNQENAQNSKVIFKNETHFSENNNSKQNKTKEMEEIKKLEFFVKEGESENDFESRVARQINKRIDAIKEEIKRQVDERNKVENIRENNYMFDELQKQMYECQDFSNAKLINKRSLKKFQKNTRNLKTNQKQKRKKCFAQQQNKLKRNKKIKLFSPKKEN